MPAEEFELPVAVDMLVIGRLAQQEQPPLQREQGQQPKPAGMDEGAQAKGKLRREHDKVVVVVVATIDAQVVVVAAAAKAAAAVVEVVVEVHECC